MLVDCIGGEFFPSEPACGGKQPVVRVGNGKWSGVVAVVGLCPVRGGNGRFFG